MKKEIVIILILFILFGSSCSKKRNVDIKQLAEKFVTVQKEFNEQRKNIKTKQEFSDLLKKRKKDLEELLDKSQSGQDTDEFKILQAKILLQLNQFDQAEKVINPVLTKKTNFPNEAKMVKIQVLFIKKKFVEAFEMFKKIETRLKPSKDLFLAYRYFALMLKDDKLKEEYSNKFLNSKDLPEELSKLKAQLLANLAFLDIKKKNHAGAKEKLKQALSLAANPFEAKIIKSLISQMEIYGKPAIPISAETWINSRPLHIQNLKGKIVIIDFWATWCLPCQEVTKVLIELFGEYDRNELVIIGYTKLYGTYRDEVENKGKVNKEEEIDLIKKYIQRNKIPYPVAISNQGEDHKNYMVSAIPTMIFITKKGEIDFIKTGANQPQFLKEKVRELLKNDL